MARSRGDRSSRARRRRRARLSVVVLFSLGLLGFAEPAAAAGTQIAGTVTSAVTKGPLEGVKVCEYPIEGGAGDACTQTDSGGHYVLAVGLAGDFVVHFDTTVKGLIPKTFYDEAFASRQATAVKVAEGATASGIDEAIQEGGHISGLVRSSSSKAPIEGIEACAQLPEVVELAGGLERHRTCGTTNASGLYAIDGLPPGEGVPAGGYEVEFTNSVDYIRQFYNGKLERFAASLIPIVPGKTFPNIDAELEEGGEISGRITSAVSGEPLAGARACASGFALPTICANTNAAGEYTITQLTSAGYTVWFSGPYGLETEYIGQYYKEKEWPNVEAVGVTAPNKTSGIDAALKAYGRIAGKVRSKATKQPLEGVNVCLAGGGCDNTNAAGEYSFSKLLAGSYALDFYASRLNEEHGTNYLSQYESLEYLIEEALKARNPEAAHVSVTMGGRAAIDDELEEGGRISGTMIDAASKKPASLWPCAEDLSTGHPAQSRVCPVSMSGNTYTISQLPPGRYRVVFGASLPAYYFTQYYRGKDLQSEAQEVPVSSGQTVTAIDASLTANPDPWEGAIAGAVTDASSKVALAGIEVCAYNAGTKAPAGTCTTTKGTGEYLLVGLPSGDYEVEFRSPPAGSLDYVHQRYEAGKAVTVVWGSITPAIDGQLHQGGRIIGAARNAETQLPAAGVGVCAYNEHGQSEACATTAGNGAYALPGLPGGNYTVGFEATNGSGSFFPLYYKEGEAISEAQTVAVHVGQSTTEIDVALLPNGHPGDGALAGKLTDASTHAPLGGIEVCAYQTTSGLFGECTISAPDGHYLLTGLIPGEYELEFGSPPNGTLSYVRQLYGEGRPVTVTAERVTAGLDAQLTAGGRVTGAITTAATGHPIQGVLACAFDEVNEVQACAPSTANGTYAITGLPAGSYLVGFDGVEEGFAIQYYEETDMRSTAKPVALGAGQTVGAIDARMQLAGSISGTITNALNGAPMRYVLACALTKEGVPVACAVSAAGGEYKLVGLPPGEWRVGFAAGPGYQRQYYDGVTELIHAKPLTVAPGTAISGIDATIHPLPAKPVPPPPPYLPTLPTPPSALPPPASATTTGSSGVLGSTAVQPVPGVELESSRVSVTGRWATVRVRCQLAPCHGSLMLSLKIVLVQRSHGRRMRGLETVVLGRGSFSLAAGADGTVRLRVTREGQSRLAHARTHPVAVVLTIEVAGGRTVTGALSAR
jgi:hypothetical protein